MTQIDRLIDVAHSQIGTKEYPSNSNRTKYGEAYGWNGVAWCCIFVWWCFREAGLSELFYGGGKCAGCGTLSAWYRNHGQWVTSGFRRGDLLIFDWTGQRDDTDHIGILEEIDSDGRYITIEGNTSTGNDSNGGEVMRRVRYGWQITGACRPKYTEEKAMTLDDFKKLMREYRAELQDNDAAEYSDEAREWSVENGIVTGGQNPGEDFNGMWEDFVTREQMVTMLYRFALRFRLI